MSGSQGIVGNMALFNQKFDQRISNMGQSVPSVEVNTQATLFFGGKMEESCSVCACAWWISDRDENIIAQGAAPLQRSSLNKIDVEFHGLVLGLEAAVRNGVQSLKITSDSELLSINAAYWTSLCQITPEMRESYAKLVDLNIVRQITWIPSDKNFYVTVLAGDTIDSYIRRMNTSFTCASNIYDDSRHSISDDSRVSMSDSCSLYSNSTHSNYEPHHHKTMNNSAFISSPYDIIRGSSPTSTVSSIDSHIMNVFDSSHSMNTTTCMSHITPSLWSNSYDSRTSSTSSQSYSPPNSNLYETMNRRLALGRLLM